MRFIETLQRKLIFFPKKIALNYQFEGLDAHSKEVFLTTQDGERIHGIFRQGSNQSVILYFHGNRGNMLSWPYVQKVLENTACSILMIDYREYGKSTGIITEKGLYLDAEAAYSYLLELGFQENQIILFGRSIGSGIAVQLAQNHPAIKALILETPYTSIPAAFHHAMPWLLPTLWLVFQLDSLKKIKDIPCPLLILHGTADKIIPYSHGVRLYEAYKGFKKLITIEGGQHHNLHTFPKFEEGLGRFLEGLGKGLSQI